MLSPQSPTAGTGLSAGSALWRCTGIDRWAVDPSGWSITAAPAEVSAAAKRAERVVLGRPVVSDNPLSGR